MPRENSITIRRGPKEAWDSANPVLSSGEFGFDTTTNLVKIGDGLTNWQQLSILALANPVILAQNAQFTNKITIRSPIVDLKSTGEIDILTVPSCCLFSIDSMEILTTEISGPSTAPTVRFGNASDSAAYFAATVTASNSLGARHIVENPQNAAPAGTTVTFGVTSASTASTHFGCGIVTGFLVCCQSGENCGCSSSSSSSSSTCPYGFEVCGGNCVEKCPEVTARNWGTCECDCASPGYTFCSAVNSCVSCSGNKTLDQKTCECACTNQQEECGGWCYGFCRPDQVRSQYSCALCECPSGKEECNGKCVDNCPAGTTRNYTTCGCDCNNPGQELCNGSCYDTCPMGTTRNKSTCQCECNTPGYTLCNNSCYSCAGDKQLNMTNCQCECPSGKDDCYGTCYDSCPSGQSRNYMSCQCECSTLGQELCNNTCYNTCPMGTTRNQSTCQCECNMGGQELCNNTCYSPCGMGTVRNQSTCECECTTPGESLCQSTGSCVSCGATRVFNASTCGCDCQFGYEECNGSCYPLCEGGTSRNWSTCQCE